MSDIKAVTISLAHLRSLLFAPGSDEEKLAKATASEADAVVADLEDAVAPDRKDQAREVVLRLRPRIVRVNGFGTEWFEADLAACAELDLDALVLPKASPESVAALGSDGPPVIAIAETADGLRLAYETAAEERVAALALGAADLGQELGLDARPDGLEILYARSKVVVDSAAAGIRPPFDVVHLDTRDDTGLEAACRFARSLGFRGKLCIHPAQVPIVNRLFAPDDAEVAWARRILDEYEEEERGGRGAIAVDGQMVDRPVVERARRILAEAKGGNRGD
jgi:citrate lyase beta subunit